MLESGFINRELSAWMSKLGHGDRFLIADAGLAIPEATTVIDLSLDINSPTVLEVLDAVQKHFSVEGITLSDATGRTSPSRKRDILARFGPSVTVTEVPHATLRDTLTKEVKFAIRTGDFTAYSNIVLTSGTGPRWYVEN